MTAGLRYCEECEAWQPKAHEEHHRELDSEDRSAAGDGGWSTKIHSGGRPVSTRLAVSTVPLPGGMVLLQVDDRWHLVVTAAGAVKIADMLHRAAHGTPMAGTVEDLHTGATE